MLIKAMLWGNPEYLNVNDVPGVAGFGDIVIFGLNSGGIKYASAAPAPNKPTAAIATTPLFAIFVFPPFLLL
jgi:hypothetical protein